ncbi:unnamed protein product, partial [Ascophyllum nodosum]
DDQYSETRRHILTYLDWYAEQCGQHMPHKDAIYLYVHSKKELFETCQRNLRTLYGFSVGCSKTYFYKVWKKYRPNIKPKTGG